jgi:hypothetical protein
VDPLTMTWYLRNEASAGAPDAGTFQYGTPGQTPITGNWSGTGPTTVGVFDSTNATWLLRFSNTAGAPDIIPFAYGSPGGFQVTADPTQIIPAGSVPVSGHWTVTAASAGLPAAAAGSTAADTPATPLAACTTIIDIREPPHPDRAHPRFTSTHFPSRADSRIASRTSCV